MKTETKHRIDPLSVSLNLQVTLFANPQNSMQEPNTMLRSAENKPTGKTMEDLVKRNALSINKSAPEITNWDDFHQTTNSATVRNYTVPTDSPPQSLPTSSSFSSKELEARQLEDACRRSEAKGVR